MSLIYRAIWEDRRPDLSRIVGDAFVEWATDKHPGLHGDDSADGRSDTDEGDTQVSLAWQRRSDGEFEAAEFRLVEDSRERWSVRARVLIDHGAKEQWIWFDTERVSSDPYARTTVAAPRVVRDLIASGGIEGGMPSVGPAPLSARAYAVRPENYERRIVDLLEHPDRITPLIVYSHADGEDVGTTMNRANKAAEILAGVATVIALPPETQQRFQERVGRDLSVWGGGARVYLPGALQPARHRYIPFDLVSRHPRESGERFARLLSASIPARRPPALYEAARPLLRDRREEDLGELLDVAELELLERNEQIDELRLLLEAEQERMIGLVDDLEAAQAELVVERRIMRSMRHATSNDAADFELPDEVASCQEAIDLAGEHLPLVVIAAEACRDIEELDSAIESRAWANSTWRALKALQAYAVEAPTFDGGFWQWCQNTSALDRWPATDKKLAMSESETVMESPKLRKCRQFGIDQAVDTRGWIVMEKHMKIAEGGGPNIPRLYFHDDTKGVTKKVHVGFFGPHRHVPNTRTN
ncbi:MAG: hypothetical protein R8F63_00720 [Acidimicrobiales bacterium]|nr:hypothetical protein [Acidimicrobiales bacterium]